MNGFFRIETFIVGFHHFCKLVFIIISQGFETHVGNLFVIEFKAFGSPVILHVNNQATGTGITEAVAFMGIFESLVEVTLEAKLTVIVVVCEKVGTKTLAQPYATFQPFVDFAFQFTLFRQAQLIKLIFLHVGVENATKGAVLFNAFEHQFAIGVGVALVLVEIGEIKICLCHVMINSFLVHLPGIFLVAQGLVCIAHDAVPVWVEVSIGSDALLYLFKHTFRFLVGVVACNTIAGLKHCGEFAAFFDGLVAQLGGEL